MHFLRNFLNSPFLSDESVELNDSRCSWELTMSALLDPALQGWGRPRVWARRTWRASDLSLWITTEFSRYETGKFPTSTSSWIFRPHLSSTLCSSESWCECSKLLMAWQRTSRSSPRFRPSPTAPFGKFDVYKFWDLQNFENFKIRDFWIFENFQFWDFGFPKSSKIFPTLIE